MLQPNERAVITQRSRVAGEMIERCNGDERCNAHRRLFGAESSGCVASLASGRHSMGATEPLALLATRFQRGRRSAKTTRRDTDIDADADANGDTNSNSISIPNSNVIITSASSARPLAAAAPPSRRAALACAMLALPLMVAALLRVELLPVRETLAQPFDFGAATQAALASNSQRFDPMQYKSVYEIIQNHPDLRQFDNLCKLKGVKEIVSATSIPLTVFAPIDKSLGDLLAKAKTRPQISLLDLMKQHIVQRFVAPDDATKYPFQFASIAQMSPLYLTATATATAATAARRHSGGRPSQQQQSAPLQHFVNNAKILQTYLVALDDNQYQTLHLIDQPLEYSFALRRAQLRAPPPPPPPSAHAHSSAAGGAHQSVAQQLSASMHLAQHAGLNQVANFKRALTFGDLSSSDTPYLYNFYERFANLTANQPLDVELYKARTSPNSAADFADQLNLKRLLRALEQLAPNAAGRLNESSATLNTFFLPVDAEPLNRLLDSNADLDFKRMVFEAHVVPNEVLFTRQMSLGRAHTTLVDGSGGGESRAQQVVELSLAKSLPPATALHLTSGGGGGGADDDDDEQAASRRLLTTPLLVEARTRLAAGPDTPAGEPSTGRPPALLRNGLTSAEIVVANVPVSNGVLHLIDRPLVDVADVSVATYLSDSNDQLSRLVRSIGSQSSASASTLQSDDSSLLGVARSLEPFVARSDASGAQVSRFRELIARSDERRLLVGAAASSADSNRTLFVPTDEAFARLRYDLRALVANDHSLIPAHWDNSYRNNLLDRLLKGHIVTHRTITSDELDSESRDSTRALEATSDGGKRLVVTLTGGAKLEVECAGDSQRANVLHRDLIGSDGVVHVLDRVLCEEQETMHSLLEWLSLRNTIQLSLAGGGGVGGAAANPVESAGAVAELAPPSVAAQSGGFYGAQCELSDLIEASLRQVTGQPGERANNALDAVDVVETTASHSRSTMDETAPNATQRKNSAEMDVISKTIEQYLSDLRTNSPKKLEQVSASVNMSRQLVKLTAPLAQQVDEDWSDKFKSLERLFTYFVPSDFAWIKAQQLQPELYRPLMHLLGSAQLNAASQSSQSASAPVQQQQPQQVGVVASDASGSVAPDESSSIVAQAAPQRASNTESSYRLRQILERHLLANRKLSSADLNQLDAMRAINGAELRLVPAEPQPAVYDARELSSEHSNGKQLTNAFSAPTSSAAGPQHELTKHHLSNAKPSKSVRFADSVSANIVQANEAANGFVYIVDNVFLLPEDTNHIVQTSSSPTMSSLLGPHNSGILGLFQSLLGSMLVLPAAGNGSHSLVAQYSMLALIGTLTIAIVMMLALALVLVIVRKRKQNKLNRHHQLESGLTSSSTASNSGSTSTTKSL